MKTIGFIGLGKMGLPMALNLCKAGFEVLIHSSSPSSAAAVEQAGGRTVPSYQALAQQADVVITIVPADKEIRELYLSPGGILDNMRPGTACIDMTSALGKTMLELADYVKSRNLDIKLLDAPVSGGTAGAASGKLTIMVGCESQALCDLYMPVFQAMGEKIFYTGDLGSASNIKMINQMINAANTAVAAEAICVAQQLGVNLKYMLTGDHTPGFRLSLMKKDVGLFMAAAENIHAFAPVSKLVQQIYQATANQGMEDRNYTCILEWLKQNQGK